MRDLETDNNPAPPSTLRAAGQNAKVKIARFKTCTSRRVACRLRDLVILTRIIITQIHFRDIARIANINRGDWNALLKLLCHMFGG